MDITNECLTEGSLIGVGNPLLDISAVVGEDMLKKYGLKANDAIMAEEKHMPVYKELSEKYEVKYIAGGSVQNSMRVAQWVLKKPKVCTYFGCVGNDEYAKILKEKAAEDGVNALYQTTDQAPTGTCAVLLTGVHRSLVANLAAAQKFTVDHLSKPECKKAIQQAKHIYVSGFFVAVSPETLMQLANHAYCNNLNFSFNISAPFVPTSFKDRLEELMPYVDVLFGNDSEAEAFAKAFCLKGTKIEDIALEISQYPKLNKNRTRVVVITRAMDPVLLVENGKITTIPVPRIPKEKVKDTNGAGDAFTGGFLGQMVLGKPFKLCVQCGIYSSAHILQHSGCAMTGGCDFMG